MSKSAVDILFPTGGLNRSTAIQSQPPYTCYQATNVRGRVASPGTKGGGTRPGLGRYNSAQLTGAASNRMNMMGLLEYKSGDATFGQTRYRAEEFRSHDISSQWTAFTGDTLPEIDTLRKRAFWDYGGATATASMKSSAITLFDAASPSILTFVINPYKGGYSAVYYGYMVLNDAAPARNGDGYELVVTLSEVNGAWTAALALNKWSASVLVATHSGSYAITNVDALHIRMTYTPSTTVMNVKVNSDVVIAQNVGAAPAGAGGRYGVAILPLRGGQGSIESINYYYTDTGAAITRHIARLILASGGTLYSESSAQRFDALASWTVNNTMPVQTANRNTALYIADYGDVLYEDQNANVGWSAGPPYNWRFESTPNVNLIATYGMNANDYVLEIVSFSAPADAALVPLGAYAVTIISTGAGTNNTVQLVRQTSATAASATASIRIRRGPKLYDFATGMAHLAANAATATDAASNKGTFPIDCRIVFEYRDRLVWCDGFNWYASRRGDPTDYDYGADPDDPGRAISGSVAEAGQMPLPITAGFAVSDDMAIMGSLDATYLLRGDPAYGGQLLVLSNEFGIVGAAAWCRDRAGMFYAMSRHGLVRLTPQGGVQLVANGKVPDEMRGTDPAEVRCCMAYDAVNNGVSVHFSGLRENLKLPSWWYDIENDAIWKEQYDSVQPWFASRARGFLSQHDSVLVDDDDGWVRYNHRRFRTDDGTPIDSSIVIGPLRAAPSGTDAGLDELEPSCETETDDVTLSVFGANTPGEAVVSAITADAPFSATLKNGFNAGIHPRVRGNSFAIKVASQNQFVLNEIRATAATMGRTRP